jgi:hypothetical protein
MSEFALEEREPNGAESPRIQQCVPDCDGLHCMKPGLREVGVCGD